MTAPGILSPASVADLLGGTVAAHDYGPADAVTVLMGAGRRVALRPVGHGGPVTTVGGVPGVLLVDGEPVTAEAAERLAADVPPARHGSGHDPAALTGPCPSCGKPTACGWRDRDYLSGRWRDIRSDPTPCLDCRWAAGAALSGPQSSPAADPALSPARAAERAAWTVHGRTVALAAGVLTVDGAAVAEKVTPAAVAIYGRRLFVDGLPVADLAA